MRRKRIYRGKDKTRRRAAGGVCITGIDIIDRGYPGTITADFLEWEAKEKYTSIITNPPYSLASEFIEKCIGLLEDGGQLAMFLKIQFLEGAKRKPLFDRFPPKYVYVFRNRMSIWNNGSPVNPDTGKLWATTICNAWYIWEKGYSGDPRIRWI